jgi:hypothetical protein
MNAYWGVEVIQYSNIGILEATKFSFRIDWAWIQCSDPMGIRLYYH